MSSPSLCVLLLTFSHRLNKNSAFKKFQQTFKSYFPLFLEVYTRMSFTCISPLHISSFIMSLHIHLLIPNDHRESLQTMQLDGKQLQGSLLDGAILFDIKRLNTYKKPFQVIIKGSPMQADIYTRQGSELSINDNHSFPLTFLN